MIWMMAPHRASRACFTGWVDPTGPVAAGVEWEWGRGGAAHKGQCSHFLLLQPRFTLFRVFHN